ncbi:MAG: tetratricopeptide repeat protein [Bacteroidota bacterium]|nr:tetratricopeptide repeat protein [Bacteroidota bacterium]
MKKIFNIYLLGAILMFMGINTTLFAQENNEQATENTVDNSEAAKLNKEGETKYFAKEYKEAIVLFNKSIQKDSLYLKAYINRGKAKRELLDLRGANADFKKAIELNPKEKDKDAYLSRGNAKFLTGDYQGSIQDYDKAIEIDHKYSEAYYRRGISKYNTSDKDGACLDFSKAGELGYYKAYDMIKDLCRDK